MIKFYQGLWSQISGKVSDANNIVFVTDRQSLMMGGQEYGKTADTIVTSGVVLEGGQSAVKKGATLSASTATHNYREGTLVYCTDDQTLLRYNGTGDAANWTVIQQPRLSAAEFITGTVATNKMIDYAPSAASDAYFATANDVKTAATTLEGKISGAYTSQSTDADKLVHGSVVSGTNNVVVSVDGGIKRTDYVLDNSGTTSVSTQVLDTSKSANAKDAILDNTLVNARTLAVVYEDLKSQAVTMATSDPDGLITWTSAGNYAGTTWTPEFHVLTATAGSADTSAGFKNNNGTLENHLAIRKIDTNDGYLATYALFNENAGSEASARIKLGEDINLVKDQFLKGAGYVKGFSEGQAVYEYLTTEQAQAQEGSATAGWYPSGLVSKGKYTGSSAPASDNAANRYLKLTFALTKTDNDPETSTDTASDDDSIIYIDVNELFDSYTGVSGVDIDQATNQISAKIADSSNEAGLGTGTHFTGKFFKNSADGLYVEGIKQEITGYIQDLSGVSVNGVTNTITAVDQVSALAGNGKFLTMVGVDANGNLTGQMASGFASATNFTPITAVDLKNTTDTIGIAATNVQGAIETIATTIGNLDYSYNGTLDTDKNKAGEPTNFIYAIEQADGQIAVTGKVVEAGDLNAMSETSPALTASLWNTTTSAYVDTEKAVPVYAINSANETTSGSIQDAIASIVDSVSLTFHDLNMDVVGAVPGNTQLRKKNTSVVPSAATTANEYEAYTIVNTIKQANGYVSATDIALVAQTVGFEPLTTNAKEGAGLNHGTGARATGAEAYIPVSGYTVGAALSSISNYIGSLDYNSVTDAPVDTAENAAKVSNNITYVIDAVSQDQGQLSAHYTPLDSENFYFKGITEKLTGSESEVRVGVPAGTIFSAIDRLANIICNYGSFHNGSDQVI